MENWGFYNFWAKNFKVMRDRWAKIQHTVFLQKNAEVWEHYLMHIKYLAHRNLLMNFMSHIYNLLNKLLVVYPTSSIAQWRFAKDKDPHQGCKMSHVWRFWSSSLPDSALPLHSELFLRILKFKGMERGHTAPDKMMLMIELKVLTQIFNCQ